MHDQPRTADLLSALDIYTGSFRKTLPPWEKDSGHVLLVGVGSLYGDSQERLGENFGGRGRRLRFSRSGLWKRGLIIITLNLEYRY